MKSLFFAFYFIFCGSSFPLRIKKLLGILKNYLFKESTRFNFFPKMGEYVNIGLLVENLLIE